MQRQLKTILEEAGFKLRKWCANHPKLLQDLPAEDKELNLDFDVEGSESIKTLGLTWLPKGDKFCIKTAIMNEHHKITKRSVISDLAKIFDPLGIMTPVTVSAKIFVQQLWKINLDWDDPLPALHHETWVNFRNQLRELNNLQVDRHVYSGRKYTAIQLHAFADASEKAYGTAIYCRAILDDKTVIVRLLCAKSKVAPLRQQTIPRLELCAAVLSAQLVDRVKRDLHMSDVPVYYWTDSQIVLAWINSTSSAYKTFVANRIASIHTLSLAEQWRHVSTKENPADLTSRGIPPTKFKECNFWFFGPTFLHGGINQRPTPYSKQLALPIERDIERKLGASVLTTERTIMKTSYTT